jgi:hypothetical protein
MSDYWPWWAGAVGLAAVTINYTITTDRSLGVSAAWDRVLHWRSERDLEQLEAQFTDDRALTEALVAATAEQSEPVLERPSRRRPAATRRYPTRTAAQRRVMRRPRSRASARRLWSPRPPCSCRFSSVDG